MKGIAAVRTFFSVPGKPVTAKELMEFKKSLAEEEWKWYVSECEKALAQQMLTIPPTKEQLRLAA